MKTLKGFESFNEGRLDNLRKMQSDNNKEDELQKMKDYVVKTYTEDWFNTQLTDNVDNYIDEEEAEEFDGDYEETYRNLCMGGAIEYEMLDDMTKELEKMFPNLTFDDISDFVNDHMIDNCEWYDRLVFQRSTDEYKSASDRMFGDGINLDDLD
ncbi:MAG: hypothetical protein SLAVMIC_00612 [uncultured marine phage]|uniref:Uncharacterized protein n=1 Tax=uncultured marine phage TaxID=707152 RepID=A0A8D9FQX7_9VIRU|nr:MAG: hypothetical protein SLAVMIC_00612 [uncultured marine phage]